MAFNVTFGNQGTFDVGFQSESQMRVSFRRSNEFNAETQANRNFDSEFQESTPMNAGFENGGGSMWLPLGGETGDLLAKRSDADGDAEWITPADTVEVNNATPVTSGAVHVALSATKEELLLIIEELRQELAQKTKFWFGTRMEYNLLEWIDPDVCYCIEEGT